MSQINTREICLFTGTATTNGTGPDINLIQGWQGAIISATSSTVSGTTPTLNIFIQSKLGQALFGTDTSGSFLTGTPIYDDLLAFAQLTTTGIQVARPVTSPILTGSTTQSSIAVTMDYPRLDGALTASDYRLGPIGGQWRVKWTVGGTSPSFAFSVVAQLIPFST